MSLFPLLVVTVVFRLFSPARATNVRYLTADDFERASAQGYDSGEEGTFLTDEDFARGRGLTSNDLFSNDNWKLSLARQNKFHGDIVGKAAWTFKGLQRNGVRRNGVRLVQDKWPGGRIPYVLSTRYSQRERAILARSIQAYHDRTCVHFVPRQGERDYIYIGKIDGCFSDVGRAGGRQEVSLDDGCVEYDTAIHELMHAVGFWHEHERWDRDQFINILWQNIDRDAYDQFGKVNLFESSYYEEKYDYRSIMHYDRKSFSKNGRDTMTAKMPEMTATIGRVKDFSGVDLKKISKLYKCQRRPGPGPVPGPGPGPVPSTAPAWPPWSSPPPTPPPSDCRDKATLCWRWVNRCRSPFFEQIMREFCGKTCGFCFSANSNSIVRSFVNRGRRKRQTSP